MLLNLDGFLKILPHHHFTTRASIRTCTHQRTRACCWRGELLLRLSRWLCLQ